jgi:hypothetical protein
MISKDQFLALVEPVTESGCWIWMGAMNDTGYGRIWDTETQKDLSTHRLSYTLFNGPIPPQKWVLHRCDVEACVNPHHLYLGTTQDNTRDREMRGRGAKREKHGMYGSIGRRGPDNNKTKLTEADVHFIRDSNLTLKSMAEKFGVSITAVWYVKKGRNWAHI